MTEWPDQIRFRAIVNHGDATGEHDGGTSILVTIPEGLDHFQKVHYITGMVAAEVSRYLAHECIIALENGAASRKALFRDAVGGSQG
jgi:hypothetical protein